MDKTWIGSGRRRSNTLAEIASAAGDDPHGLSGTEHSCRYWSERLNPGVGGARISATMCWPTSATVAFPPLVACEIEIGFKLIGNTAIRACRSFTHSVQIGAITAAAHWVARRRLKRDHPPQAQYKKATFRRRSCRVRSEAQPPAPRAGRVLRLSS